jgi:phosphoribosylglycinamide formyltransferase-1
MLLLFYEREVEMQDKQINIAVLVSGGGTNLQALIDAEKRGELGCGKISVVIASKPDVYALERAKNNSIRSRVLARKDYESIADYSEALTDALIEEKTDLVVLAGFLTIIDEQVYEKFENRILNVHPALIPSFCGKGYYGLKVHEAALEKGVKVSGATVHIVTPECDAGPIVLQKAVEVLEGDTPETLQKRIMEQAEWKILPEAVKLFCDGRITVENNKVTIKGE